MNIRLAWRKFAVWLRIRARWAILPPSPETRRRTAAELEAYGQRKLRAH